jgi:low affinity Fe/Cu permease
MFNEKLKEELERLPTTMVTLVILISFVVSGFLMAHTLDDLLRNVSETRNDVKTLLINHAGLNQMMVEHEKRISRLEDDLRAIKK